MRDNVSWVRGQRATADYNGRVQDAPDLDDDVESHEPTPPTSNMDLLLGKVDFARKPSGDQTAEQSDDAEEVIVRRPRKRLKFRHAALVGSFLAIVAVPSAISTVYMTYIAADQYHSSASFSVRGISGSSTAGDIMGMFGQASSTSTVSDSYILMDYIQSADLLTQVEQNFDLEKVYARRGLDFYYSMGDGMPLEKRLGFWRSVIDVSFDHSSGIITAEIRAFDPKEAQSLATFIISRGEQLINDLSNKSRDEVLRSSRQEMARAELRLMDAREQLRRYRDEEQEIDPTQGAQMASNIVAGLESQLTELNTSLMTARQRMSDDAPRIKVLLTQIASLKDQIDVERQRLGSGGSRPEDTGARVSGKTSRMTDVASRIQRFEVLRTQEEFALKAYEASLAAMEKARMEADAKQRYLATFIRPGLSEQAQYPKRILDSILTTLAFLFAWIAAAMIYYNIRDRA